MLDVGCFDETALIKRDTEHWLHGRIGALARDVVGIDNSEQIRPEGLATGSNAIILRGDGVNPTSNYLRGRDIDLVVAREGFVRVTAGYQRVAQHDHPQATFKPSC